MPFAFAILIFCQLAGEMLGQALHLRLPGPLIGMFLLTLALASRAAPPPPALAQTANGLIANMGLLFVPAGVGVIAQMGLVRQAWLPILAGLIVSTVLGIAVTGLTMHHVSHLVENRPRRAPAEAETA